MSTTQIRHPRSPHRDRRRPRRSGLVARPPPEAGPVRPGVRPCDRRARQPPRRRTRLPTGDYRERIAQLSVEHARTLDNYRDAHDIHGKASTEELCLAVVRYRTLFADLLGEEPVGTAAPSGQARPHIPRSTRQDTPSR